MTKQCNNISGRFKRDYDDVDHLLSVGQKKTLNSLNDKYSLLKLITLLENENTSFVLFSRSMDTAQ